MAVLDKPSMTETAILTLSLVHEGLEGLCNGRVKAFKSHQFSSASQNSWALKAWRSSSFSPTPMK
jgi:hypothetical protein